MVKQFVVLIGPQPHGDAHGAGRLVTLGKWAGRGASEIVLFYLPGDHTLVQELILCHRRVYLDTLAHAHRRVLAPFMVSGSFLKTVWPLFNGEFFSPSNAMSVIECDKIC
jgi:hypothetical protein